MKIIENDGLLCKYLARSAGKILFDLQKSEEYSGRELGDIGDKIANDFIIAALKHHRANDAILSEEEFDDAKRLAASRAWIIDPLDGTREYSECRDDWAVHIGLALDGEAKVGAVAIPAKDKTFSSMSPKKLHRANNPPRILISRTRPPAQINALADYLAAEVIQMGSAGAKAMAIIDGAAEIYFHQGGQYEWDNCAPVAVAKAAGLFAGDIYGNELQYNKPDKFMPNLLICREEYAHKIAKWAKENIEESH